MTIKMILFIFCVSTTLFTPTFSLENVAVVEHSPKTYDDPRYTIKENINEYRKYLEDVKDLNVDVIVFPEYGLTGYVEDVENWAIDINKNETIRDLSAMATEYRINMIVNLLEKDELENYYNTNLVFNKTGVIIAKYHKININPVTESKLRAGNEVVEFMLEGKPFATITNDDILFDYPTNKFSDDISFVAIPMNWRNIRPFNVATSMQAAYAIKNNKVVLAANLNDVDNNKTGSGIYSQDGNNSFISGEKTSDVITTFSFRRKRQSNGTELDKLPRDMMTFISDATQSEWYDLTWRAELNHENQSCSIYFPMIDEGLDPLLPWGVLSGYKEVTLNESTFNVRLCAYIACDTQFEANFELKNCGKRYTNGNVTFEKVEMRTNLNFNKSMPITLDYNLKPLDGVTWREVNGNIEMDVNNINQMLNMVAVIEYTPIIKVDNLNKITSGVSSLKLVHYFYLVCSTMAFMLHYVL